MLGLNASLFFFVYLILVESLNLFLFGCRGRRVILDSDLILVLKIISLGEVVLFWFMVNCEFEVVVRCLLSLFLTLEGLSLVALFGWLLLLLWLDGLLFG